MAEKWDDSFAARRRSVTCDGGRKNEDVCHCGDGWSKPQRIPVRKARQQLQ